MEQASKFNFGALIYIASCNWLLVLTICLKTNDHYIDCSQKIPKDVQLWKFWKVPGLIYGANWNSYFNYIDCQMPMKDSTGKGGPTFESSRIDLWSKHWLAAQTFFNTISQKWQWGYIILAGHLLYVFCDQHQNQHQHDHQGHNCHLVVWPSLGKDSSWIALSVASFAVAEIVIFVITIEFDGMVIWMMTKMFLVMLVDV